MIDCLANKSCGWLVTLKWLISRFQVVRRNDVSFLNESFSFMWKTETSSCLMIVSPFIPFLLIVNRHIKTCLGAFCAHLTELSQMILITKKSKTGWTMNEDMLARSGFAAQMMPNCTEPNEPKTEMLQLKENISLCCLNWIKALNSHSHHTSTAKMKAVVLNWLSLKTYHHVFNEQSRPKVLTIFNNFNLFNRKCHIWK